MYLQVLVMYKEYFLSFALYFTDYVGGGGFPTEAVLYTSIEFLYYMVLYGLLLLFTSHLFFHRHSGTGLTVAGQINMKEINLLSLKRVDAGHIVFIHNPDLCYIKPEMFISIISNKLKQKILFGNNKPLDLCSMYHFETKNLEEC